MYQAIGLPASLHNETDVSTDILILRNIPINTYSTHVPCLSFDDNKEHNDVFRLCIQSSPYSTVQCYKSSPKTRNTGI